MSSIKICSFCLLMSVIISSCMRFDKHREEGEIFHAAPMSNGIGSLYFGLYKDHTYQICNTGGLAQSCQSSSFKLNKDTLTLLNLNTESPLKSNRLLIVRYAERDSTYWQWKYSEIFKELSSDRKLGKWIWQNYKHGDSVLGNGDVYQLDIDNNPIADEYHFIIRLDSIKNFK